MMTRYHGKDSVKGGFYWNLEGWEIVSIPHGGVLPGTEESRYLRLPVVLLLLVGPLMGAVYAIFLPFIGFAMVAGFAGKKLLAAVRSAATTEAPQEVPAKDAEFTQ